MKRFLAIAAFALLLPSLSPAQRVVFSDGSQIQLHQDKPLDDYVAAREKLIRRYVLDKHYAWGVSVSGGRDIFTDADSGWLTVYLYKDSVAAFAADFDQFATKNRGGNLTVDGITVVIEVITRKPKGEAHGQPKTERNDRQPERQNGRSGVAVPSRPSRS